MSRPRRRWSARIATACALAASPALAEVSGPLRVLETNPRYLTNDSGRVVLLLGSHDWNVFQDYVGPRDCDRHRVPFSKFVSNLQAWGHSFTRGWTWEDAYYEPTPYRRACGNSDYTLDPPLNLAYLQRLRQRVRAMDRAGLYTSVLLFQGWSVRKQDRRIPHPWPGRHPYHKSNNCSGSQATDGPKTHELDRPAVRKLQEAYVRALVRDLNSFDNIIWEISNESHRESRAWQIRMANVVRETEAALPKQHPIWISCAESTSDLFLGPAEVISPCKYGGYTTRKRYIDPPENRGEKVMLADSDHLDPTKANDVWAWKSFMRGLQPIFMDQGNYADWACDWDKSRAEWQKVRDALGAMLVIAEQVDLAVMAPQPKGSSFPSAGHYALFSTDEPWSLGPAPNGDEFLVYFEAAKERRRLCGLVPDRDYVYQWSRALDATARSKLFEFRQKAGNRCRTFTNQASFSRVLRVSSALKPPRASIATRPGELVGAAPFTVDFDASGSSDPDGTVDAWEWFFPTAGALGPSAQHTFEAPGRWQVTLTVTDDDGLSGSARVTVEVSAAATDR